MANQPFNIAKGRAVYYGTLPAAADALVVVLLQAAEADDVLNNYDDLAALIAAAGNTEATFTNYCVDPETECLTRRAGWTRYNELVEGDEILAYNKARHVTRWERPDEVFVNPRYVGPMCDLSMRGFSAVTTPDHRWPVLRVLGKYRGEVKDAVTRDLPGQGWALMRSAPHEDGGGEVHSDAFVRVAAWYFTEGSLIPGGKAITISQSGVQHPDWVEDIRLDLKELGGRTVVRPTVCTVDGCTAKVRSRQMCLNHYQAVARAETRRGIKHTVGRDRYEGLVVTERVRDDGLVTWDISGCDVDAITACVAGKDKVPTPQFLASLTMRQARLFVETALAGDGSVLGRIFYQHNTPRMDAFAMAATLAGFGPTVGRSGTNCSLNERPPYLHLNNVKRGAFDYDGPIWCPVLPSGYWVARRNGCVHITGNSRKTETTATVTIDDTNNWVDVDIADQTWSNAGGATNNTLVKLLVCYDGDTAAGTDANITPLSHHDFAVTTDGSTLSAQFAAAGFYRAS